MTFCGHVGMKNQLHRHGCSVTARSHKNHTHTQFSDGKRTSARPAGGLASVVLGSRRAVTVAPRAPRRRRANR